jgi:hypothetical protein
MFSTPYRYLYHTGAQIIALFCFAYGGVLAILPFLLTYVLIAVCDELLPYRKTGPEPGDQTLDWIYNLPILLGPGLALVLAIQYVLTIAISLYGNPGVVATTAAAAGFVSAQPLWVLAAMSVSLVPLTTGIICPAHELYHHPSQKAGWYYGQLASALCLHTSLPIEHTYGHHRQVGLYEDSATARRGEGFWRFVMRSVPAVHRKALAFEQQRLSKHSTMSAVLQNRAIQGYLIQATVFAIVYLLSGLLGLVAFLGVAFASLLVVESFNYLSHYGLVRVPGTRARREHCWEWNRAASTSFMLNLTRHSDHHERCSAPYWELEYTPMPHQYPYGPNIMIVAALLPPLFRQLVAAPIQRWDRECATDSERGLLRSYESIGSVEHGLAGSTH